MNKEKDNVKKALKKSAEEHLIEETTAASEDTVEQLSQCKVTLAEWQEKYARLTADLENYKKRTMKERSVWAESAQVALISELLAIVDNFDRAMEHQMEVPQELQAWADGIAMIHTAFKDFLKKAGVKEVPYNQFNPEYHEALIQVDSEGQDAGEIVSVMEKGYMLKDRVLRPAKVSVAK